eukprot:CAMPEP_0203852914 /NCGR_PEP_ID=MMETSP0359-20131031/8216_1 /ASSEMBLY_ACC=CAM_ASM_000338 /TAXON_ID=268821 /ORGANISM="Scrippsiella Hangoei, Strain SHTV-5" /LENGTH=315 /DNA_ID=CAMNT_0050769167 /DNA_START=48 /DNA_END=995 /DNA_ORIENTATION=-
MAPGIYAELCSDEPGSLVTRPRSFAELELAHNLLKTLKPWFLRKENRKQSSSSFMPLPPPQLCDLAAVAQAQAQAQAEACEIDDLLSGPGGRSSRILRDLTNGTLQPRRNVPRAHPCESPQQTAPRASPPCKSLGFHPSDLPQVFSERAATGGLDRSRSQVARESEPGRHALSSSLSGMRRSGRAERRRVRFAGVETIEVESYKAETKDRLTWLCTACHNCASGHAAAAAAARLDPTPAPMRPSLAPSGEGMPLHRPVGRLHQGGQQSSSFWRGPLQASQQPSVPLESSEAMPPALPVQAKYLRAVACHSSIMNL